MIITFSAGRSWFGSGRSRHSVEYTEALVREGGLTISFRRYPNNTVIQYENNRNSRKHKITSKVGNFLFCEKDVKEFFELLGIGSLSIERESIVNGLQNFTHTHTVRVFTLF